VDDFYAARSGPIRRYRGRLFHRRSQIAAIAYWNTIYLDRAAQHLTASGVPFDDALLAHLSPMGWAHISLTGDYLWHRAKQLAPGEFRSLNDPMARLKRVA
jgi:hypothetical protein